jgi:hypothetical protein
MRSSSDTPSTSKTPLSTSYLQTRQTMKRFVVHQLEARPSSCSCVAAYTAAYTPSAKRAWT